MTDRKRYFGQITFPESEKKIESVWLIISDLEIYMDVPMSIYEDFEKQTLWGHFAGLDEISLLNCFTSGGNRGNGGGSYRKVVVNWIIQLPKMKSRSEPYFSRFAIPCPNEFSELFANKALLEVNTKEIKIPKTQNLVNFKSTTYKCTIIDQNHFIESEKYSISMRNETVINIAFNTPQSFDKINAFIHRLERLFFFVCNRVPKSTKISVFDLEGDYCPMIRESREMMIPRNERLINLVGIDKKEIKSLLRKWLDKDENNKRDLINIINLIYEKYTSTHQYESRDFLSLCVGLESFHKYFSGKKIALSDTNTLKNRDKIKSLIHEDEDLLKWFRQKTSFMKDPDLIDRLVDLKPYFTAIIHDDDKDSLDEILTKIKNTRNKLAHEGVHDFYFKSIVQRHHVKVLMEGVLRLIILDFLGVKINEQTNMHIQRSLKMKIPSILH